MMLVPAGVKVHIAHGITDNKQLFRPRLPHGEFTPDPRHQNVNVGNRSADFRVALRSRRGR